MTILWKWCTRHPSLVIGSFLMLASSGLDGAYMTLWMPGEVAMFGRVVSFAWLGLVLNTASDITGLYLGTRIGRLMRSRDATKRQGGIALLALSMLVALLYGWFFCYLQLRRVLPTIEGAQSNAIAAVAAGFIPLTLAILGILDGLESFSSKLFFAEEEPEQVVAQPQPLACPVCHATSGKGGKPFLSQAAVSGHMSEHRQNGHKRESVEVDR